MDSPILIPVDISHMARYRFNNLMEVGGSSIDQAKDILYAKLSLPNTIKENLKSQKTLTNLCSYGIQGEVFADQWRTIIHAFNCYKHKAPISENDLKLIIKATETISVMCDQWISIMKILAEDLHAFKANIETFKFDLIVLYSDAKKIFSQAHKSVLKDPKSVPEEITSVPKEPKSIPKEHKSVPKGLKEPKTIKVSKFGPIQYKTRPCNYEDLCPNKSTCTFWHVGDPITNQLETSITSTSHDVITDNFATQKLDNEKHVTTSEESNEHTISKSTVQSNETSFQKENLTPGGRKTKYRYRYHPSGLQINVGDYVLYEGTTYQIISGFGGSFVNDPQVTLKGTTAHPFVSQITFVNKIYV